MINLKNFRENPSLYKKKYKERFIKNSDQLVDEIISLDSSIRQILEKQQKLQEERNKISKELSISKDKKSEQFISLSKKVLNIKNDIEGYEKNLSEQKHKINNILHNLPNIHLDDVPVGEDSKSNKEIKKFGNIKNFNFKPNQVDEMITQLNKTIEGTGASTELIGVLKHQVKLLQKSKGNGQTLQNVYKTFRDTASYGNFEGAKFLDKNIAKHAISLKMQAEKLREQVSNIL